MPLRDPTPDELKELGVAMATPSPTASSPTYSEQGIEALRDSQQFTAPPDANRGLLNLNYANVPPTALEKIGMRMAPTLALPAFGGAVAGGGILSQMLGQGTGMLANEGFSYLTQPPEERPSLGGALLRTGFGVGMIGAGGWVANKLSPAIGKGGAAIPEPAPVAPQIATPGTTRPLPTPPIPTPVPGKVGREVATDIGQTIKDKIDDIFGGLQDEAKIKSAEIRKVVQEVGDDSMVDVRPIIQRLRTFFGDPKKVATLNPAEDAARAQLLKRAAEIEKEAALNGGRISLDRAYRAMTKFGARGYEGAPEAKSEISSAYRILRAELREGVEQHIAKVAPESAQIIKDANAAIHSKLTAAEDLDEFITSDPAVLVKRLQNLPKAKEALAKLDKVFGTKFTSAIDDYSAKVAEVERLRKAIPEANQAAQTAFRTTSKAVKTENAAQEAAAEAVNKVNRLQASATNRANQEAYKKAVQAADASKASAMKAANILSRILGAVVGYESGQEIGLPGSRWVGLMAGGALGPQIAPAVARGMVAGGRALPKIVYPTEVALSMAKPKKR